MLIGSHIPTSDLALPGAGRSADAVQVFLSAPRQYRAPAASTVARVAAHNHPALWVHAPYLINVCSARDDVRVKSIRCLDDSLRAAAQVGAQGLVVHAGQAGKDGDLAEAIDAWVVALSQVDTPVPLLIENTAGGTVAPGRHVDDIARLFDAVRRTGRDVGFCLDTCHSHAGEGIDDGYVDRLLDAVGHVDLLHLNGSQDTAGSGRDRHANLHEGQLPFDVVADVARACGSPAAVVETPGGADAQSADIDALRDAIN